MAISSTLTSSSSSSVGFRMLTSNGGSSSSSKSLERIVSRSALQAGRSAPCKAWTLGFFSGACAVYLLAAALPRPPYPPLRRAIMWNSTSTRHDNQAISQEMAETMSTREHREEDDRIMQLYRAWSTSLGDTGDEVSRNSGVPPPPHLDDCRRNLERHERLDSYGEDGAFPPWTLWRGSLGLERFSKNSSEFGDQTHNFKTSARSASSYPPWIVGSDEQNYPLTRRVQRDIWVHQHPPNCGGDGGSSLRFLVADWERLPGFGIGAQIAGMSGLLAIAMKEKRILVTGHYNRADHNGCKGDSRSSWSCYFFPETSSDCRKRAFELMQDKRAFDSGTMRVKENYTSRKIWVGSVPRMWGEPWKYIQPTTDIQGSLIAHHRKMNRRWWIAQAARYLMRFQTGYTCKLVNVARHSAFGMQAAKLVQENVQRNVHEPKASAAAPEFDIERLVWSTHKPYVPRPLLSIHVRMGDKACEMAVVGFEKYMELASRLRRRFPALRDVWLSTETKQVVDTTKHYQGWNFHFTSVARQDGNMSMATYEARLGRETGTNCALVNLIMAGEADFFVGALGSTWCYLIDGMRNTGGKVMSGYLSVNKDRFW